VALAAMLLTAVPAGAQTAQPRLDLGVGVHWLGAIPFAAVAATETALANAQYTLFKSESTLQGASGIEGRLGVRLTSLLRLEGSFFYARPSLQTRIRSDVENIPDVTLSERISQYIVEAGVSAQLARWTVGRLTPFGSAGGGYLRQLHDGRGLVETGRTYYIGAGVRYPLTLPGRGLAKSSGIRADVKAELRKNGVALDTDTHVAPSLSASFFLTF
jgi:hypothetical protein